jgi:hypothetical protein
MGASHKKCRYFMSLLQVFDIGGVVPVMVSGPSFIFGKYAFKKTFPNILRCAQGYAQTRHGVLVFCLYCDRVYYFVINTFN